MPTYPVKHKETGETKELSMTMKDYDQWRKDNPDWDKDWSVQEVPNVQYGDTYFSGIRFPEGHNRNKNSSPIEWD